MTPECDAVNRATDALGQQGRREGGAQAIASLAAGILISEAIRDAASRPIETIPYVNGPKTL